MHYFIYHLLDYENTDMNLIHSKTYNPALAFVPVYFGLFGHQIWLFHFWTANHKFEGLWIIITLRRNVFGQCRNASFLFSFFSWWITECFCQTWRKWTLEHSSDYTTSVSKIKWIVARVSNMLSCFPQPTSSELLGTAHTHFPSFPLTAGSLLFPSCSFVHPSQ